METVQCTSPSRFMNSLPLLNCILKIIATLSAVFVGGMVLVVLSAIWDQTGKDRPCEQKLSPSIQFVQVFRVNKGRLPSEKEFENRPSAKADWMTDLVTKDS